MSYKTNFDVLKDMASRLLKQEGYSKEDIEEQLSGVDTNARIISEISLSIQTILENIAPTKYQYNDVDGAFLFEGYYTEGTEVLDVPVCNLQQVPITVSETVNGEYLICELEDDLRGVLPCTYYLDYDSSTTDGIGVLKFANEKLTFIPNEPLEADCKVTIYASGILKEE